MYSNRLRMVGLSGIDTDMLVGQLMKAESVKLWNLKKQNTMLQWQQEKYRSTAKNLQSFSDKFISLTSATSLRMSATFGAFQATPKLANGDAAKQVSARATSTAKEGTYKLQVLQLASKAYAESAADDFDFAYKIKATNDLSSAIANGNLAAGDTINFTLDGTTKAIEIKGDWLDDTNKFTSELRAALNKAFGRASGPTGNGFEVGIDNGKLFISMYEKNHELTISDGKRGVNSNVRTAASSAYSTNAGSIFNTLGELQVSAGDEYKFTVSNGGQTKTVTITIEDEDTLEKIVNRINTQLSSAENGGKIEGLTASIDKDKKLVFTNSNKSNDFTITDDSSNGLLAALNASDTGGKIYRSSTLGYLGISSGDNIHKTASKSLNALGLGAYFNKQSNTALGLDYNATKEEYTITLLKGATPADDKKITVTQKELNEGMTLQSFMNRVNSSKAGIDLSFDNATGIFKIEAKNEGTVNGFTNENLTADTFFVGLLSGSNGSVTGNGGNIHITAAKDAMVNINGKGITTYATNKFTFEGIEFILNETTWKTSAGAEPANAPDLSDVNSDKIYDNYDVIDITVAKDNTKTLEILKDFVAQYNELVAQLNGEVSATRPKNGKYSYYEPLTDDERNAMSEREIDLWEAKAKEGILSRDSILSGITRDLRAALSAEVRVTEGNGVWSARADNEKGAYVLSLSRIGITTSPYYWEGGKLIIDEAKLEKAIDDYGEGIMELFTNTTTQTETPEIYSPKYTKNSSGSYVASGSVINAGFKTHLNVGIAERLRLIIDEGALGSEGSITKKAGNESRAMSLTTNDMYKRIKAQDDKIADMLNRLAEKEDAYYAMFAKMEAAVIQANNQMTYLQQQLGI